MAKGKAKVVAEEANLEKLPIEKNLKKLRKNLKNQRVSRKVETR